MSIVFFSFIFLELNQYIKQNIDEKTFIKKKSLKSFTKTREIEIHKTNIYLKC